MTNLSILDQSINPGPKCKSSANLPSPCQCQSSSNRPMTHQYGNPMSIHYQSSNSMSILEHSANPPPIHQSCNNPTATFQSNVNLSIQCQSANPLPIFQSITNLSIHHQSKNPMQIVDKSAKPSSVRQSNADTVANIDPSANPGLICQSIANPPIQRHTDHIRIHKSVSASHKNRTVADWQPIGAH